jgi:hypothetical protein
MNRSTATSIITIIAALGLLAFASTQALFTDSQTATGAVNAAPGNVDLRLNDVSLPCGITNISEDEITFESFENMLPGDSVTCAVELENEGSAPFDVDVTGAATGGSILDICDGPGDDLTVTVNKGADTDADDTLASTARVEPGVADTALIQVTFNITASNACQGLAALVSVEFTANSVP